MISKRLGPHTCLARPSPNDLSIDDSALAGQGEHRIANAREAGRELAAVLRENDDVIASLVKLAAIPVEFYFVKPSVAGGWSNTQRRLSGDDERRSTQHRIEYTSIALRGEDATQPGRQLEFL
jgi:hypothetical protein